MVGAQLARTGCGDGTEGVRWLDRDGVAGEAGTSRGRRAGCDETYTRREFFEVTQPGLLKRVGRLGQGAGGVGGVEGEPELSQQRHRNHATLPAYLGWSRDEGIN